MEAALAPAGQMDAAGRTQALEQLVDAYGDGVLHLAYLYLKDRDLAEDVFQDAFTRVYLQWHKFRGDSSPKTWIYRIVINLCRDKLRSWNTRRVLLLGEEFLAGKVDLTEPDAEDEVLMQADNAGLLECVMALPLEYREVVLLYYYEEMDTHEVAAALGSNPGTVRSRLFRARAKLKQMLMEGGFTHGGE